MGSIAELNTFWKVVFGTAAVNSVVVWVVYLALEPWVRRRWPQTMISWSRYSVKGWRDPLVGRDLLYAVGIGALFAILDLIASVIGPVPSEPDFPDLSALLGLTSIVGNVMGLFANSITGALIIVFLLFALRVALRKEWLAVVAVVMIIAGISFAQHGFRAPDLKFVIAMVSPTILVVVILRFGLFAAIFASAIQDVLRLPHTLDFSAWYAGTVTVPLLLLTLLAIYGFRTSLGGRRLIQLPV